METLKRKYKTQYYIIKYVLGTIVIMYLLSMCTYLISTADTMYCILGILGVATLALIAGTNIIDDTKKLIK